MNNHAQQKNISSDGQARYHFYSSEDFLKSVRNVIKETDVVTDIGCGICPMNYFRPKLHIMVEPWKEYVDILAYRHFGDKSALILQLGALEALKGFATNSVDSIFMLDVIEHIEKLEGFQIIKECERIARQQIVIFTPLGFMPQTVKEGEKDGWGLSGAGVQEHLSGWVPEDFSVEWSFYICKDFHLFDHQGRAFPVPYGAFYAIRNFEEKKLPHPKIMSDMRLPLPSEIALQQAQTQLQDNQALLQQTQALLQQTQAQLSITEMRLCKYQNHFLLKPFRTVKRICSVIRQ
ncbi:MAG: hypothetical protein BGO67_01945 [Alphaproteobacteria bacterium 41-28]|nr:MAG: hypothetical protein BGO67_01945 [Alphaproteobacteria bacterium 41-28]